MRSLLVGSVMATVVTTLATLGHAGEAAPTARPKIELAPQVRVVGFHRAPSQSGAYTGGALAVAVDLENAGSSAVDGLIVKLVDGDDMLESAALSIGPRGKRTVYFTDPEGLSSSCKDKPYTIQLSNGVRRSAHVTPTCAFSTTIEETWNQMSPDRVDALKTGNAYLTSPALVTAPSCGKGPTLKVRIVNKAAVSSPSIIVQAKDWSAGGAVKAQTSAALPLASNEQKELLLTPVSNGDGDVPAKMKLGIVDWTKSLKGHTSDGGIFVNTSRSCSLAFDLD